VYVTLALVSAAFYGAADFLGGIASKRADSVVVTFVAQAAGLVLLALLLPVLPSSSPVPGDYVWASQQVLPEARAWRSSIARWR
jgi:hypothetical protein